jgi:hypothetical protein
MNRSSIWCVLLAVACAANNVDTDNDPNDNGGAAASGSSSTGGKAGSTSSNGGGGLAISTGGSLSATSGSAGTSSSGGKTGTGGGGAASTGGTGGHAGGSDAGGTGGKSSGAGSGGSGSGGTGRIDQKDITTQYQAVETGTAAPVQHIYGQIQIVNMGGGNAYLKDTKVRYYFTNELAPTVPQFEIQLKQLRAPNLTVDFQCAGTIVKMATPTADADTYIEFTFPNDPQVLDSGKTGIIQFRIFDPMPTQPKFDQSNDYSFNAKTVPTDKITLYYKDNIIWGNEPGSVP